MSQRTASYGKCERVFAATGRTCNRPAKYLAYGTRKICRQCYQSEKSGNVLLFNAGPAPTPEQNWAFMERLRADL